MHSFGIWGTVLGLIRSYMFVIYINNFVKNLQISSISAYVDDTLILSITDIGITGDMNTK